MTALPTAIATRSFDLLTTQINSFTLVVIDSGVANHQALANSVLADVDVIVLSSDHSGVSQITDILQQNPCVKTLHIVSHGAPGVLFIGNELLDIQSLDRYSVELRSWNIETLFIYGCQVAAGDAGQKFLQRLNHLTGAAIAASTTQKGSVALGGNWNLEVAIGSPQPSLVFDEAIRQQYAGVLALLNAGDYAALKALYQSTNGANWANNTGWKDWDFNSTTPPDASVASGWKGVGIINFERVASLNLHSNNLSGSIPSELGNLSCLNFLDLGANQLSGSIPSSLGSLSQYLNILILSENQLSGTIPVELGNLSNLNYLNLSSNQLSGTIPSQLGNLNNLSSLYLNNNALSGDIPTSILSRLSPLLIPGKITNYDFNNAPFVTAIADQSTNLDHPFNLDVSVSDIEKGSNDTNLTLNVTSSNSTLLPNSNISVTGSGSTRTIAFFPTLGQLGTTTITMTLTDGGTEQTVKTFQLTVDTTLNADDYAALKGLYQSAGGANWTDNTGWKNWDFNSNIPPLLSMVSQWKGVSLTGDRVTDLSLSGNNLTGSIPTEIGNLTGLTNLNLTNNHLSGSIPSQIGNLTNLIALYLYGNQLSGSIPAAIGNLTKLSALNLDVNQLSGSIPVEIGNLTQLTSFSAYANQLSGTLPAQISNLTNLANLDLHGNQLSGSIPSELGNLAKLTSLDLSGNQLSGNIPQALLTQLGTSISNYNLNNAPFLTAIADQIVNTNNPLIFNLSLSDIDKGSNENLNNLTLTITSENLDIVNDSDISVTGTGSSRTVTLTPTGNGGTTTIRMTLQDGNGEETIKTFFLTRDLPINASDYAALKALYQSTGGANWTDNTGWKDWDFNSPTPPLLTVVSQWKGVTLTGDRVTSLNLHSNNLSGTIPTALGNLSSLSTLDLGANSLSGTIPTALGNLSQLSRLDLSKNQLTGSIPSELASPISLFYLDLSSNQLSGTIPTELDNAAARSLRYLYLNDNVLSGDVPPLIHQNLSAGSSGPLPGPTIGNLTGNLDNVPYITPIANQIMSLNDDPLTLDVSFSDIDESGNDTNLSLSVTSDNPTLIDSSGILVLGREGDRTLTLTPIAGKIGTATITMTLQDDGTEKTVKTFQLTVDGTLNADDYAVLKTLYQTTGGANWTDNTGWKDWNFNSTTPPALSVVSQWKGVSVNGDRVTSLNLHLNNLSGTIPTELGNLSELLTLDLGANNLSGTIPTSLENLSQLSRLDLSKNQLTSSIPSELGSLMFLSYLNLSSNQLSGTIPQRLNNNASWGLDYLYLNDNALGGDVPVVIRHNLAAVGSDKLMGNLDNAPYITSIGNQISPPDQSLILNVSVSDIDELDNDTNLSLSVTSDNPTLIDNYGILVTGSGSDRLIIINPIAGKIGTATITMTLTDGGSEQIVKTFQLTVDTTLNADDYAALKALYQGTGGANWADNTGWKDWDFNSSTPPALSAVSQWKGVTLTGDRVTQLNLESNNLSGNIPTELGNLSNLVSLNLGSNPLGGTIPSSLGNLSSLNELILNSNELSGSIPTSLGNLTNLKKLILYNNQLSGSIPTELKNLSQLQVLNFYSNQLSGSIPTELGSLSNLTSLALNYNAFTGSIPTQLGNLTNLQGLSLDHNQLSGSIPGELANLTHLTNLYLVSNQLTGTVPQALINQIGTSITDYDLNNAPFLTTIADQTVTENKPLTFNLSIGDIDQGGNEDLNNLTLTVTSDNSDVIDNSGISVSGTGSDRTLTLTPGQSGTTTIRMLLKDTSGEETEKTFDLTVDLLINASDYAALKTLYQSTGGANWTDNTGWKDWDFNSATPPRASVVSQWKGVTLTGDRVTSLSLGNNNLIGTLPTELGNLSNLTNLYLDNNQLSGTIPVELGNLSSLTNFSLNDNQLSGTIPTTLGNLSKLTNLYLNQNQLSGDIPTQLGDLTNLKRLRLNNNQLSGTIPTQLSTLTNLTDLNLSNNQLSGTIPSALASLSNLASLTLNNNQLSGAIPIELGTLSNLSSLYLYSNQLTGSIPTELSNLSKLRILNLFNNQLSGSIPTELGKLSNLTNLNLSKNQLSGSIPTELSNLSNLTTLNLGKNQLSGSIPTGLGNLSKLRTLYLYDNQLSGTIPVELGNLSNLENFALYSNQLSGSIPTQLGNLSNMVYLSLSSNQLSGSIPVELGNLSKLQEVFLDNNQLSGSIPTQLGNLSNLIRLYLYSNQLSGSIPAQLGNLTKLQELSLDSNQLSGSIPVELGNLSNLVFLDLRSLPLLIGSIPVELGKLSNLAALHLENTQVSGSIPAALGNLTKLVHLYLNNTQLGGSVPTELGNLTNLVQIYLNSNQLGGQIPQGITSRIGNGITKYDLDNAPYLSTIANQSTTSDKPLTLTLSVSDIDTAGNADPTVLTLKAVSDNSALIGESGISVSGTGSDRILTLTPTPGQTGTATITLTLQDDSGEKTEKTFIVTVNASSISTTPGTGTTPPAVTPISSITSLFNAAKSEFIVSDALLSLNPETLPSGSLFRLRQGTPKADKLQGTGSKEAIFGKANNDLIKGQGGNDCLSGGKGNDLLYGGAGNDLIFGDAGNDTLVGEAGNDVLIGGAGSDRITTGTGSDQVGFAKPIGSKSIDTITDFNAKVDHIVVSAKGFGGGLVAGQVLSTTQFQTGTKAIGSANRFIYNRKTGDLFFDADGSGAGKAIAFTHLNPGLHLTSQNISIV